MFKLATNDHYKEKVTVEIPQDLGKTAKGSFIVHFKTLNRDRIEELAQDMNAGSLSESEVLREVVVGFEDVQDEDGQAMEYSEHTRDKLLNIQYVHTAVMKAFLGSLAGKQDRRKN